MALAIRSALTLGLTLLSSGAIASSVEARPHSGVPVSQTHLASAIEALECPAAVFVEGPQARYGHAKGLADGATGQALTIDTPLRIASNTKTFVAATILRLWEDEKLDLDAPIAPLLTPQLDSLLRANGYATGRITIRHLLSHSAGLADHAGDPRYLERVLADPQHAWTRQEQVEVGMSYSRPLSEPGEKFSYSDTGYILLGDIVERVTGKGLAQAVRELLGFGRLGLATTWWEVLEPPAASAAPLAHQFIGEQDGTELSATLDLYGGGGLVMSLHDLAMFTKALFEGRVFRDADTLEQMLWLGRHEGTDDYRLGVMVHRIEGKPIYGHNGFWGTAAWYSPETATVASGATLNRDCNAELLPIVQTAAGASR
jgi:D-alanyl-D-alanine carboxypeptidase